MKHADVHAELGDYLEGDLTLDRRALVDAHLDACPECAGRLRQLRATVDALRSLGDEEPSPGFAEGVMARIAAGEGRPSPFVRMMLRIPPPLRGRLAPPLVALASAAIVLVWLRAPEPVVVPSPTASTLAQAIREGGPAGAPAAEDEAEAPAGPKVRPDDLDAALRSPSAWLKAIESLDPTSRGHVLASLAQRSGSTERLHALAQQVRGLSDPGAAEIASEIEGLLPAR